MEDNLKKNYKDENISQMKASNVDLLFAKYHM